MSHYHAVVWLDHRSARVLHIARGDVETHAVRAEGPGHLMQHAKHIHHRAGTRTGNHAPDNHAYFDAIVAALGDAHDWLIVGPGTAKQDFMRHLREHRAPLVPRVVGVESADHPTDKEIAAHARRFFVASDRMRPRIES